MSRGAYDRELVMQLLPAAWDPEYAYGMRNPYAPDPDMPKGSVDKKKGSSLNAHLTDIRQAWKKAILSRDERVALLLRFGFDWTQVDIAAHEGCRKATVSERCDRGVGKLTAFLNGEEYVEGYGKQPEDEAVQV